jgi:ribosome-associated protein
MIEIKKGVEIPEALLAFRFSRSSGPGGQNVNKVSTRVTLLLDIANCPALTEFQKKRIGEHLKTRIGKDGVLRVISQRHRTQAANKNAATTKLVELLAGALETKPHRRKTKTPAYAVRRRLEEKKRRGMLKKQRVKRFSPDDE